MLSRLRLRQIVRVPLAEGGSPCVEDIARSTAVR